MKRSFLSCAGGLLAGVAIGAAPFAAALGDPISRQLNQQPFALSLGDSPTAVALDRKVEIFIELDVPSVAEVVGKSMAAGGGMPDSGSQKAQAARVEAQQAAFRQQLANLGVTEVSSMRVGANGLHVKVPASRVSMINAMSGVRSVAPVTVHTIENAQSVPWIGAPEFWAAIGTGEGVSIGVIDTGTDYDHANLGGDGDPATYAANDPAVVEPGTFPTAKVVGGWDFVGNDYTGPGSTPMPDPDPLDCNGHGSHVSGTATGLGVPGIIGQGVAPGADLYGLKVFGCNGSTTVTDQAIEWAMDPNGDGDMSDHLDVINMSLGSAYGLTGDGSAIASNNAAAAGVIVVTSAGNSGDLPYVTGSPGVASMAISTAASTKGGQVSGVEISGDINEVVESIEGTSPVTIAAVGPISGPLVQPSDATNMFGCNAIADDMTGAIALIRRGGCGFVNKSQNATAAGAIAMLVYNDGADPSRVAPIVMGGLQAETIPSSMTTSVSGDSLAAALTGGASLTATMDAGIMTETAFGDLIASFSSRGPGGDGNNFKPDVTAPGVSIVSTAVGTGTGPLTLQGTSMASPHVAGVAALMRQQYPDMDQAAIKGLIQSSSVDMNPFNGILPLTRQGVGRVDVPSAMNATAYAMPAGVGFGRLNPAHVQQVSKHVRVYTIDGSKKKYNVTHVPNQAPPGVTVSCSKKVTANGEGGGNLVIKMRVEAADVPPDDASFSHQEADGWCVLDDGVDTLKVGYTTAVDGASRMNSRTGFGGLVNIRNLGNALGWAEGFTQTGVDGLVLDGEPHAIAEVGFRTNDFGGIGVVEMGVATDSPWGAINNLQYDFFIDADFDGVTDFQLQSTDWSTYGGTLGTMITAQFDATGSGFLDWIVTIGDFNDRTAAFPFSTAASGFGFVPEAFDYTLIVTGRDGTQDVQIGTVDLANEVIPAINGFGLLGGDEVTFEYTSPAHNTLMWLFQNNPVATQVRSNGVTDNVD